MNLVELHNVSKKFGQKTAVDNLSLNVQAGQIYAFLGPNGAGKTTTIKMIVGLLRPDSGSVRVCGYDISRDGRLARGFLAYVPDQPFIYEKLTGREFLEFVGRMYGMTQREIDEGIAQLGAELGLGEWLDTYAEGYSHGMKQRVVLTAALLHRPRVLVIDEPMVGLDPITVAAVKRLFRRMRDAGGAVFLSTHTLETAEDLADRIGIIDRGRLIAEGTLEDLKQQAGSRGRLEELFIKLLQETAGQGRSVNGRPVADPDGKAESAG